MVPQCWPLRVPTIIFYRRETHEKKQKLGASFEKISAWSPSSPFITSLTQTLNFDTFDCNKYLTPPAFTIYYYTILFLLLGFSPPESLPGDDVLCRLLPRPLPSVCFLFFSFLFRPTVFVPNLFWCNFLYLVTTAGFVADQLIM